MILIVHQHSQVIEIRDTETNTVLPEITGSITAQFLAMVSKYPDQWIGWCNKQYAERFSAKEIVQKTKHKLIMASYSVNGNYCIADAIGYADDTPFVNVNRTVNYPTWLMSADAGITHAKMVSTFTKSGAVNKNDPFEYFLTSLAKLSQQRGVFCYSDPALVSGKITGLQNEKKTNFTTLFRFVKQHYKARWIVLMFFNLWIYEKRFPFWALLKTFFLKRKNLSEETFNQLKPARIAQGDFNVDVLIPTIGRKKYLHEVLKDLAQQTIVPKSVIIVEQNPDETANSELDYLEDSWPFEIKHKFTHQTGACNARNVGLKLISSDWVFMADDDIRFESNLFEKVWECINAYDLDAVSIGCLQEGQKPIFRELKQSVTFGSGTSFVKRSALEGLSFDMAYEFGFGEDGDFGMQLRNKGVDVIYEPTIEMLHLKAPVGGFRTKPSHPWEGESIQPKPSPMVMVFNLKNKTREQLLGYKTILFFKFYRHQSIKNPISYFKTLKSRWERSIFWAQILQKK